VNGSGAPARGGRLADVGDAGDAVGDDVVHADEDADPPLRQALLSIVGNAAWSPARRTRRPAHDGNRRCPAKLNEVGPGV
jgi:hypothetical protein